MDSTCSSDKAVCPQCQTSLAEATHDPTHLICGDCHGTFVLGSSINNILLEDAETIETDRQPLSCPACKEHMKVQLACGVEIDHCTACGGIWLDEGEQLDGEKGILDKVAKYFFYSLSVPERTARSTVGLAAGAATEISKLLVPQAFQNSKTYSVVVKNSLKFLTENVAGTKGTSPSSSDENASEYVARKAVGNFLDLAGLMTLHVSPLWLFAIVSDVAYGSKSYVLELSKELKEQGLIDDRSSIGNVDELLAAVQEASGSAANLFDTPPLSTDELKKTLEQTRDSILKADVRSILPESELRDYWDDMRTIARTEHVSLLEVSGAMTMHSMSRVTTLTKGAGACVQVAGGIFNKHILGHYTNSLAEIHEKGYYETVRDSYAPYMQAVWDNFSSDRETFTERVLTGKAFSDATQSVRNWFSKTTPEST